MPDFIYNFDFENRDLKEWRQELRDSICHMLIHAAKDVQDLSDKAPKDTKSKDVKIDNAIDLSSEGFAYRIFTMVVAPPDDQELVEEIKNYYSAALSFSADEHRIKVDGQRYADMMMQKWAGSKIINIDELYDTAEPDVQNDLRDALKACSFYDYQSRQDYFHIDNYPQNFEAGTLDMTKLKAARFLLSELQNVIKADVDNSFVSKPNNRPSPWVS